MRTEHNQQRISCRQTQKKTITFLLIKLYLFSNGVAKMNEIEESLQCFQNISLFDIGKAQFMNRIDYKFILHKSKIPTILSDLKDEYFVLKIDDEIIQPYQTTYFDTSEDQMYLSHQNGHLNRFKIRNRFYELTKNSFLEVKMRNNKGRCIKKRVESTNQAGAFSESEQQFIQNNSPYESNGLEPKIKNQFYRITLVNKTYTDRVTIDLHPQFKNSEKTIKLDQLVIIEVKLDRYGRSVKILEVLKQHRIRRYRISKYCIGRALLEDDLKKNSFKPKLIKIKNEFT